MRKGHTNLWPIGETNNGQQSITRPISSLIPFQKLAVGKDGKKRTPSTKPVSREEREEREERTLKTSPHRKEKKYTMGKDMALGQLMQIKFIEEWCIGIVAVQEVKQENRGLPSNHGSRTWTRSVGNVLALVIGRILLTAIAGTTFTTIGRLRRPKVAAGVRVATGSSNMTNRALHLPSSLLRGVGFDTR